MARSRTSTPSVLPWARMRSVCSRTQSVGLSSGCSVTHTPTSAPATLFRGTLRIYAAAMQGQLPRRAFVRGAVGAAAGALLTACDDAAIPPGAPTLPASPSATSAPVNWGRLATDFGGRVVLPSARDFAEAKSVFNSRFDDSKPAAVVVPASLDDVRRAMDFAMANGVHVAPRSGGHSYIGASAASGTMVIDLRPLAGAVAYDAGTGVATVPAAARLDAVQTTLAAQGTLPPVGQLPDRRRGGPDARWRPWRGRSRPAGLTCDALPVGLRSCSPAANSSSPHRMITRISSGRCAAVVAAISVWPHPFRFEPTLPVRSRRRHDEISGARGRRRDPALV